MELKSITISGYRNIYNTTLSFNDLTSILSLNNYGKSNLLASIVFGLSFVQQHPKIKQNMMDDVKCIPNLKRMNNTAFSFTLNGETIFEGEKCLISYSFAFNWGSSKSSNHGRIIYELLKIKNNSQIATQYMIREDNFAFYKPSKMGRCTSNISIESNELVINKLFAFDNLFYNSLLKEIQNVNVYIDRHFDTNLGYGITFMSEQELTDLTLNPEINIPKTLYRIKKNHKDKFALLVNVFTSLFPSIKDLCVYETSALVAPQMQTQPDNLFQSFSDKYYLLFVEDRNINTPINFLAMSDGAKRILLLLTFVVLAELNNYDLICIEEPENSIHPGLLRKFLYTISELAGNTKLLFSSHSPYLINYMQPENIYLGLPNQNGVATFKKLKTNTNAIKRLIKNIQSSNMQLGDYLFDLMSSSDDDDIIELSSYVE